MNASALSILSRRVAQIVLAKIIQRKGLEKLAEDTPWLDFISDLIQQLLPILIGCFGATTASELHRPGLLTRVRLRMAIRQSLGDRETIDLLAGPLFDAMLDAGDTVTDADIQAVMAA